MNKNIMNFYNDEKYSHFKYSLYNGNFELQGQFWTSASPDTIKHEIIPTEIGSAIQVTRGNGFGCWQLLYSGREIYFKKDVIYVYRFLYKVVQGVNDPIPFNVGWNVLDYGAYRFSNNIESTYIGNGWYGGIASYTFKENHPLPVISFINGQQANTIINFAYIELLCPDSLLGSIYLDQNLIDVENREKNEIIDIKSNEDSEANKFSRYSHIIYAFELFKSYSLSEKLLGNGFDYMFKYSNFFFYPTLSLEELAKNNYYDYPHNPIISALLYSGIVGGLFYLYFLMLVFFYYWKYRNHHLVFFLLYLVAFFFCMVSGNSHFSVPIFTFLSIIPFITKYYVENKHYNGLL
jgi:hypothetical protein